MLLEDVEEDFFFDAFHFGLRFDGFVGELEVVGEDAREAVLHDFRGDIAGALDALEQRCFDGDAGGEDIEYALGDVVRVVRDAFEVLADDAISHDGELVDDADLLGDLRFPLGGGAAA